MVSNKQRPKDDIRSGFRFPQTYYRKNKINFKRVNRKKTDRTTPSVKTELKFARVITTKRL